MHITVVIPTYNRRDNLDLVLTSLRGQGNKNFSVVVADDGSDDNTDGLVTRYHAREYLKIAYYYQTHDGYRVSRARNMGVQLAEAKFQPSHILFLDSDVMLNPRAIEHYYWLIPRLEDPTMIVCGRYDWLPPMQLTPHRVLYDWEGILAEWSMFVGYLEQGEHDRVMARWGIVDVGGRLGRDPRNPHDWFACTAPRVARGITISGNLLVPLDVFKVTGGFDEAIKAQGQDCEFSYNLWSKGYRATICGHAYGLHAYHLRDRAHMDTVQWTIKYIHEKYKAHVDPPEKGIEIHDA